MVKQCPLAGCNAHQPAVCGRPPSVEPLVFPFCPSGQNQVQILQGVQAFRPVETTIVVHPPPYDWVDELGVTVQPGPDSRVGNSLVLKSASGPTDAQIVGAQRRFSKPTGSFPPGRLRSKDGSTLRSPTRRLGVVWPRSSDIARRVLRLRGASRRKQRISLRMMGPAFLQGQPGWRA